MPPSNSLPRPAAGASASGELEACYIAELAAAEPPRRWAARWRKDICDAHPPR